MIYLALLTFSTVSAFSAISPRTPVARINNKPIFQEDLKPFQSDSVSPESALDKLILFELAVNEARRQKLDASPEVKFETKKVLYKKFLGTVALKNSFVIEPSPDEIARYYASHPQIRIRHLVLPYKDSASKVSALNISTTLQNELARGEKFKALVLKYSQDESAKWGGDLGYRGENGLPPLFYRQAIKLSPGQVVGPLDDSKAIHYIELLSKRPFREVSGPYREYLVSHLRAMREKSLLDSALKNLKNINKVEIIGLKH